MLARLLSLIAAATLACASAHTHANAHLPQPETAHRAFATIAETASRAEALLIASDLKANCHRPEFCASAHRHYANNSPYRFTDPDGRDSADRAYGAAVGFMLRNNPEMLKTWAAGEAAATTEGSGAEAGAGMGLAIGAFVDAGDYSKQAVAAVAVKAMVMLVTKGKARGRVGDFTRTQKRDAKRENAAANDGTMRCTDCNGEVKSVPSQKGVSTPDNQAQVHHDPAIKDGGGRDSKAVVLCPPCHQERHSNEEK